MKSHSKRGAALAYVIVITAALLVFAAALFSVAGANLNASQNSLEGRQAYLDAKSAIEYGRAYLALHSDEDVNDFSILPSDKGAGFKIVTGSADGAIAEYDSSTRTINAAAKYKSSDRVRRLGYRFGKNDEGNTVLAWLDSYLEAGLRHGQYSVFNGSSTHYDLNGGTFFFPILANQTIYISGSPGILKAEQIYCMGAGNCVSASGGGTASLSADFLSFKGNLSATSFNLILKSTSGIVYFESSDIIVGGKTIGNLNGYYECDPDGFNVFNDSAIKQLTKLGEDSDIDGKIRSNNAFVLENYGRIISAQDLYGSNNGWTKDGKLDDGKASVIPDKLVYFYASNIWSSNYFNNHSGPAIYGAKEIYFQYVSTNPFIVPAGRTVVYQADYLSVRTQNSDSDKRAGPVIKPGDRGSHFYLTNTDGTGAPVIVFPADTTINFYTAGNTLNSRTIPAGTYTIDSDNKIGGVSSPDKADLFDDGLKLKETSNAGDGTGGSDGGTVTGGVYTDGQ
jgi:Type II secretory pathway, component PulK